MKRWLTTGREREREREREGEGRERGRGKVSIKEGMLKSFVCERVKERKRGNQKDSKEGERVRARTCVCV
jgi:hypothetical protein